MRRFAPLVAVIVVLLTTAPAQASGVALPPHARPLGRTLTAWQKVYIDWLTTSSANLLFNPACGEVVDGMYFAPVAVGPGIEVECHVPTGTMVLVSPAGSFSEIPTFGSNDSEIIADAEATFGQVLFSSVTVDGKEISPDAYTRSAGAYNVGPVEQGSFFDLECETLQPPCVIDFQPGDVVRLASVAQVLMLAPLSPGTHTVVLADQFSFSPVLQITMTLHVG